ncbi:hypothetical protein USB125703_00840 [Pseudoclavibacter triregionum]|nr:hypothetical protein USB125703_00840 [Pseudoclavibacter triregionum]
MRRERREHSRQIARARVENRPHPIESPDPRQPAQQRQQARHRRQQMRGVHRRRQHAPPDTGMRERPHQRVSVLPREPPAGRRVGKLHPVELGLLTRRMLDDRVRTLRDVRAGRASRPEATVTDLPRQRLIRALVAQRAQLVVKRHGPEVGVLGEPRGDVVDEHGERVRPGGFADARGAFPGQVGASSAASSATSSARSTTSSRPTLEPAKSRVDNYRSINALAEAVNNLYKTELIRQRGPWRTVEQVELATLEWVWWWNHQRLQGELGMRTPIEIEDAYYADLESGLPATAGQGNR